MQQGSVMPLKYILCLLIGSCALARAELKPLNLLVFYDSNYTKQIFEDALAFLSETDPSLGVSSGTAHRVYVDPSHYQWRLEESVCPIVDEAFASEDEKPDFLLDLTRSDGNAPEMTKLLGKAMRIPTIAGTSGQEGDIKPWRELTSAQKGYLIQINPPGDILLQAARSFADMQNMTNAAVIVDNRQYEIAHKQKLLFQNLPMLAALSGVNTSSMYELTTTLRRFTKSGFTNYFLALDPKEVERTLYLLNMLSEREPRIQRGYSPVRDQSPLFTLSLEPGYPSCRRCNAVPGENTTLIHLSPDSSRAEEHGAERREFLQRRNASSYNSLTDIFYFDLAVSSILAAAEAKKEGKKFESTSRLTCAQVFNGTTSASKEDLALDLYPYLESAMKNNMLPIHMLDRENGRNYPSFRMKIQRLQYFGVSTAVPKTIEDIGSWVSGFREKEAIEYNDGVDLEADAARTVFTVYVNMDYHRNSKNLNKHCDDDTNSTRSKGPFDHCFRGNCITLLNMLAEQLDFKFIPIESYGARREKNFPMEWSGLTDMGKDALGLAGSYSGCSLLVPVGGKFDEFFKRSSTDRTKWPSLSGLGSPARRPLSRGEKYAYECSRKRMTCPALEFVYV